MPTSTSRLSLLQPIGADPASELRLAIAGNATTLDAAAVYLRGTLASRPAAGSVAAGTFYDATDTGTLKVAGNPWRTWSNKTAWKAGDWTVTVTDAGGQVLKELTFKVQ